MSRSIDPAEQHRQRMVRVARERAAAAEKARAEELAVAVAKMRTPAVAKARRAGPVHAVREVVAPAIANLPAPEYREATPREPTGDLWWCEPCDGWHEPTTSRRLSARYHSEVWRR